MMMGHLQNSDFCLALSKSTTDYSIPLVKRNPPVFRSSRWHHQALEVWGWRVAKVSSSFVGSVYQLGPWSEWEDPVWGRGKGYHCITHWVEFGTYYKIFLSSVKELIFDSSSVYKLRLWYIMIHIIQRIIGYTGAMTIRHYMRVIPIIPVLLPSTGP